MRSKFKWIFSLLLALSMQFVFAQEKTVTGVVSDATGPIPGANVVVRGTNRSAQTDFDGKYSIKANAGEVLVFSFVGMKETTASVGASSTLSVRMEQQDNTLEEVVVVGYGTQKKKNLTGSISQIKGDAIASLATPSFESQLAGRAAGVQVTSNSGVLGQAPRIRIRGIGSISSGSYPLVVVDGVPIFTGDVGGYANTNALGDINPADIESTEILKDGSATAIYGSRASNGVILITTKKGKGGKFRVNYNTYTGVASPIDFLDLLGTKDFVTIQNEKRSNRAASPWAAGTTFNTDWQKAVLRSNAFQTDHNLSLSGSTDKTNYYFSIGYNEQEGIAKANNQTRYNVRANVDQKVKSWLNIGVNMALSRTQNNGLNTGANSLSGLMFNAMRQLPNTAIYDATTPTGYNIAGASVGQGENLSVIGNNLPNIVYVLDNNIYRSKVDRSLVSLFADFKILPSLNFKTQGSVDAIGTEGFQYLNPINGDGAGVAGSVRNNFTNLTRWNVQNILSYNKTFGDAHTIGATAIYEAQKQKVNSFFGGGNGLSDTFFNQGLISGSYATQVSGGSISENGIISYAGRLTYNYKEKYFLQGSIRKDGLSSLPSANKWGAFPGVSAGWSVNKESFMTPLENVVSEFKLRASYAEVGNTDIGNYPYLGLYNNAKYAENNAIAYSQASNFDLRWETSEKIDYGVDLAFLNNRLKFTYDYFINNQDGLILAVPQPLSLGVPNNSISKNIGALRNSGHEISVEASAFKSENFEWTVTANLSLVKSKVNTLVNGQDINYVDADNFNTGNNILREGESPYSLYGFKYWGVNPANGNPVYYKADGSLVQGNIDTQAYRVFNPSNPSDISVASSLSTSDKSILGSILPTYFGAFNSNMRYKDFDLGFMFRFSGGNKIHNSTRRDGLTMNFNNNSTEILGRWQSASNPGDGLTPRLRDDRETFINLNQASTRFVEDGDYIKLDNVTLGYNLPRTVLEKIGVDKFRLFVQGQNLLIITDYKGLDPEMEITGIDLNGTPRSRVFTIGLNVGF
ncbi:SusC/RagA family TonB-linked outer membrane protein [Flavobacterium sp. LB2R40]|uniref:SusC/RagA family TonB-linked outer membrane protein n=1 Tax=unclassified Flavobacterium TaxID=196869 RepID=UPI003AAAAC39